MKNLLFFLTLLIPFWVSAQLFTIQGYVTDAGTASPIANHSVSINSTTPSFPYTNTVMTNMVGFYSDAINVPSTVPQIAFVVTTNDCNGNTLSYTVVYFNNGPNPAVANFQICSGSSGGCQAYFTSSINGATASFQNQSQGGTSYFWDFGNGQTSSAMNPNVTYAQSGAYSVCLTVSDSLTGCIDTYCDTLSISVTSTCQADFVATASGTTAAFSNTSTGVNNNTTYSWNFGDGTASSAINPTHTYTNTSLTIYYVCLYIYTQTSTGVCIDSTCQYLTIAGTGGNPCQAYFTAGVNGGVVSFQNQSTPSGYFSNWNFGNGQTSSVQHPTHTYTQTGWYNVCLFIYDSTGCQSTYCDSIYINVGTTPTCTASYTYTLNGNVLSFNNTSTGGTPNTMTYTWIFGNGNTSNAYNPTQTFNVPGIYTICLYILNTQNGCTDTTCQIITIPNATGNCAAAFTYQINGTTGGVNFGGIATGTPGYNYTWSFGDGTNSVQQNPTHTYTQSGVYTVCLLIVDATGCTATHCDTLNMSVLAIENVFVSNISALYPNPTQDKTSFNIDLKEKANIQVEILNTIGQRIDMQNTLLTNGSHTLFLSTENLAQGMYFVKIAAEGQLIATKRLIKE